MHLKHFVISDHKARLSWKGDLFVYKWVFRENATAQSAGARGRGVHSALAKAQ